MNPDEHKHNNQVVTPIELSGVTPEQTKDDPRYRLQHRFWLDMNKDDEFILAEQIAELKSKRLFQSTIKDALRLIMDLRAGQTDVLSELFPDVVGEVDNGVLARIEALLENGHKPEPKRVNGLKPLVTVDDDILDIRQVETGNSQAGQNLINCLMKLQE